MSLPAVTASAEKDLYLCLVDLCDDEELKERIAEIQREIEHSRLAKSRELSRRRSTNIRRYLPCVWSSYYIYTLEKSALDASPCS